MFDLFRKLLSPKKSEEKKEEKAVFYAVKAQPALSIVPQITHVERIKQWVKENKFPFLVAAALREPKVMAKILDPKLDDFWMQVLLGQAFEKGFKPYPAYIPFKPHCLTNIDKKVAAQYPTRHPFDILVGYFHFNQAYRIRRATEESRADFNALPAKEKKNYLLYLNLGIKSGDFCCISQKITDDLMSVEKAIKLYKETDEKVINEALCNGLIENIGTTKYKELDEEFIKNLLNCASQSASLHLASGYLLYAHTCFRLGRYFAERTKLFKKLSAAIQKADSDKDAQGMLFDIIEDYKIRCYSFYQEALKNAVIAKELEYYCENIIRNNHLGYGLTACVFINSANESIDQVVDHYKEFLRVEGSCEKINISVLAGQIEAQKIMGASASPRLGVPAGG